MALEYIWEKVPCDLIRICIHHFSMPESTDLKVNAELKQLLKKKGFRWKTVTNNRETGQRTEFMECSKKREDL